MFRVQKGSTDEIASARDASRLARSCQAHSPWPQDRPEDQVPGQAQCERRRVQREQRSPGRRKPVGEHEASPYGTGGEGNREPDEAPPEP